MTDFVVQGYVDHFSAFRDTIVLTGWCFCAGATIEFLEVRPAGFPDTMPALRFKPAWLNSPDVATAHGPYAVKCRFEGTIFLGLNGSSVCGGQLWAVLDTGHPQFVARLGDFRGCPASDLTRMFFESLQKIAAPNVLEIGSRARSGITRRAHIPAGASYTGCDIVAGENVDVVCDAHAMSRALPAGHYQAAFALSVVEHLLMPWKFVLELNKVMAVGGIGLFSTHQCWPIHDAPWDFWRFSDRAWAGLLNTATGFEIIGAAMGEPAYIVAQDCHPVTNFAGDSGGFLASNVLFRKIGNTDLRWDVPLDGLADGAYPG